MMMMMIFWLHFVDVTYIIWQKKKWANIRDTSFSGTVQYVRKIYTISGLKVAIIKKVIVVVNCKTGYKFEYYQKNTRF